MEYVCLEMDCFVLTRPLLNCLHDLDELHLTPFHGAVQLRPSFKYLDKIDEKKKQATRKVSDEDNKEMQAKAKAEDAAKAKALQVTPQLNTGFGRLGLLNLCNDAKMMLTLAILRCK